MDRKYEPPKLREISDEEAKERDLDITRKRTITRVRSSHNEETRPALDEELAERLEEEYAEAWRPEPGEKLIGRVVSLRTWSGPFGAYPIVVVEQTNGVQRSVHAFRQVLATELAAIRPEVGERIGIKYEGRVTDASGPDYHSYRVVADRPSKPVDWADYAAGLPEGADEPEHPVTESDR